MAEECWWATCTDDPEAKIEGTASSPDTGTAGTDETDEADLSAGSNATLGDFQGGLA